MKVLHLATRFFGSLRRGGPADESWALEQLTAGERTLWSRTPDADRRHAVEVAHRMGDRPRPVLAAALLHDVGKIESGFGTFARVGATLAAAVAGRERLQGRIGQYLRHDELGAELLKGVGSDPLVVAWAREHHLPSARWTVPLDVGAALKAADDD